MKNNNENIQKIEKLIGQIMRICVITAFVIMLAGLIVFLYKYLARITFNTYFSITDIPCELKKMNPYYIMNMGVFVLILTPIIRVIATIILFLKSKNTVYTIISATVLLILIASFIISYLTI